MTSEQKLLDKLKKEQATWKATAGEGIKEPNLKNVSDALDKYYFLSKLKVYCSYLSYGQIVQEDKLIYQKEDFHFIKVILKENHKIFNGNSIFQLYNNIRILFENIAENNHEMESLYWDVKEQIYNQVKYSDRGEILELYSFLTNYCIKKLNLNYSQYQEKLFILQNDLLNLKYYGQRKKQMPLPAQLYKNMISVAILLRNNPLFKSLFTIGLPTDTSKGFPSGLIWAERFLYIYKSKLDKKFRKIYPPYCAALLSFFQGDYLKAYHQLGNPRHIQGEFIHLDIKTLQLRILYEVQQIAPETLEKDGVEIKKVMDAFRQLIRYEKNKKQQLKYQLNQYMVFEKCFKELMKFHAAYYGRILNSKNKRYSQSKILLKSKVTQSFSPYRDWFLAKLAKI